MTIIIKGAITGYDSNETTGGLGARLLAIGGDAQYRRDIVTVSLRAVDVRNGEVKASVRSPDDYGLATCNPEDLAGGEGSHNAAELVRVFKGEDMGAHRDALLMGTSLVLELLGNADNPKDGVAMAAATIDDGRAAAFLDKLRGHFDG